jgi:hypothetical protein
MENTSRRNEMKKLIQVVTLITVLLCTNPYAGLNAQEKASRPAILLISLQVTDLTTGKAIKPGQTVTAGDQFQVTVTTDGVNCAGQFVVTATGAPGAPPAALVQVVPYIIGPFGGNNSASGGVLTANGLDGGKNDWKVSTSCNGASPAQFGANATEFFAE